MVVIPAKTPTSTSTGTRSTNKLKKTRVYLEYPCYICGNILSRAKNAIDHVRRIHGFDIPTRDVGRKRPQDNEYEYIKDKFAEVDEMHFACSSCWYHCPQDDKKDSNSGIRCLNAHYREEHDPIKVDITKEGSDVYHERSSGRSSRRDSVDESSRSRRDSDSDSKRRSTTPNGSIITEESAKEISSKLDELAELFKRFFQEQ